VREHLGESPAAGVGRLLGQHRAGIDRHLRSADGELLHRLERPAVDDRRSAGTGSGPQIVAHFDGIVTGLQTRQVVVVQFDITHRNGVAGEMRLAAHERFPAFSTIGAWL
jgi:hypothetical protein